jgi:hypothetical protein
LYFSRLPGAHFVNPQISRDNGKKYRLKKDSGRQSFCRKTVKRLFILTVIANPQGLVKTQLQALFGITNTVKGGTDQHYKKLWLAPVVSIMTNVTSQKPGMEDHILLGSLCRSFGMTFVTDVTFRTGRRLGLKFQYLN